jgi:hypothetical protein
VLFVGLSGVDFAQTYALIRHSDAAVYEANPVAAAWLDGYGWRGLAIFKAGTILLFLGATAILAYRRPRVGIAVIGVACLVLLLVTVRSRVLLEKLPDTPAAKSVISAPAGSPLI